LRNHFSRSFRKGSEREKAIFKNEQAVKKAPCCHPELDSGSVDIMILLDAETSML
jgi:hypothetical protein